MPFTLTMAASFVTEVAQCAAYVGQRMTKINQELEQSPGTHTNEGNIKKLAGFNTLYRYRVGDYRLIYSVQGQVVRLLMAGKRADIYDRLKHNPDAPDAVIAQQVEALLMPNSEVARRQRESEQWQQIAAAQVAREETRKDKPLATEITSELLTRIPNIPARYHQILCTCRTEDDLLDAPGVPEDIKLYIIGKLSSLPVTEIGQQPVKVVSRAEDINEFLEGRLSDFLLLLDESQEKVVDWALQGPTLVKGGPGSGKSTVAMYRVREVMRRATAENRTVKVLFTTYTTALVNVSRQLLSRLLEGISGTWEVKTLDSLAMQYARQSGFYNNKKDPTTQEEMRTAIQAALAAGDHDPELNDLIARVGYDFLMDEFSQVIEGRGITSINEYMAADRTGRQVGLRTGYRQKLWQLYQASKLYTHTQSWGDIRTLALKHLETVGGSYDYVIIDEAQDLTPQAIRLCIALAKSPQGVYLTADLSQSIYNRGFPLSRITELQDATRRTRILRRNYRSTVEIVHAASEIIGLDAGDRETLMQSCIRNGPKPVLLTMPHHSIEAVAAEIADYIRRSLRTLRLPLNAAAVLCRKRVQVTAIAQALNKMGIKADEVTKGSLELDSPSVKVITLHSAKGLEFPVVIIPFVDANVIPEIPDGTDADAVFEVEERERRLLFVGLTRAMRRLMVSTSGSSASSPFVASATEAAWAFEAV